MSMPLLSQQPPLLRPGDDDDEAVADGADGGGTVGVGGGVIVMDAVVVVGYCRRSGDFPAIFKISAKMISPRGFFTSHVEWESVSDKYNLFP